MVRNPQEAIERISREDEAKIKALEARIDEIIDKDYTGRELYIEANYPSEKVFREIRRMYESAGWTSVNRVLDQRGGDYIVLSYSGRTKQGGYYGKK